MEFKWVNVVMTDKGWIILLDRIGTDWMEVGMLSNLNIV